MACTGVYGVIVIELRSGKVDSQEMNCGLEMGGARVVVQGFGNVGL